MAFDEVRFPTKVSWGITGGPEFNTDLIILNSGFEKRNANWSISRAKYEVAHNLKTQSEINELVNFFRCRQGKARGFRFRDWSDYTLSNELIGVGDGSETEFQVIKTYTNSTSYIRNIMKIVSQVDSDSIASSQGLTNTDWEVFVNSVLQTESSDYTINRNTGIITFSSPVTNTHEIRVYGEFDVPVRFDTDTMGVTLDSYNNFNWQGIPLVEVRI